MQLLAKFKKILYMGFRATLNFRKFIYSGLLAISFYLMVGQLYRYYVRKSHLIL